MIWILRIRIRHTINQSHLYNFINLLVCRSLYNFSIHLTCRGGGGARVELAATIAGRGPELAACRPCTHMTNKAKLYAKLLR